MFWNMCSRRHRWPNCFVCSGREVRHIWSFLYTSACDPYLDYKTTLPGRHWSFSAESLVEAVNSPLAQDVEMRRFRTRRQPNPLLSFDGLRHVLPMLNGLSGRHLHELFTKFADAQMRWHVFFAKKTWVAGDYEIVGRRFSPM